MDEKEILAQAAEELTEAGDIEEVQAVLTREKTEAFPIFLFTFALIKDILDFPVDITEMVTTATGVGVVAAGVVYWVYLIFVTAPVSIATFIYMWGKIGRLKKMGLKYGLKAVQGIARRFEKRMVWRLAGGTVISFVPFLNMFFPGCLLILFAHNRYNKIVAELLHAAEIVGTAAGRGVNPYALRAAADAYAGDVAQRIVRAANLSGRAEERGGAIGRQLSREMKTFEKDAVQAGREGGRVALAAGLRATRMRRQRGGGTPPPAATGGRS